MIRIAGAKHPLAVELAGKHYILAMYILYKVERPLSRKFASGVDGLHPARNGPSSPPRSSPLKGEFTQKPAAQAVRAPRSLLPGIHRRTCDR